MQPRKTLHDVVGVSMPSRHVPGFRFYDELQVQCFVVLLFSGRRHPPWLEPSRRPESPAILMHVTTSSCEFAQKELLGKACTYSFSRANSKISEHESGTTIGFGIVKVGESR